MDFRINDWICGGGGGWKLMMYSGKTQPHSDPVIKSSLFDEKTFYRALLSDLSESNSEVIIESPFITTERMTTILPTIIEMLKRNIRIYVVTRDPNEHIDYFKDQAEREISNFERLGVNVLLCTGNHHRKIAIIDRHILYEGSLNILSQTRSREIMRRIEGEEAAIEMFNFLNLGKYI